MSAANLRTLSVTDVVARTGFTRSLVYRLVRQGRLVAIRATATSRMWITEASLEQLFAASAASDDATTTKDARAPRGESREDRDRRWLAKFGMSEEDCVLPL